jgi:cytochrome c oxidase assembly protein subunit 19
MGFGRPSNTESTSGAPPLLGSFPLDHDGEWFYSDRLYELMTFVLGECKQYMQEYMKCLRANKNNNGACREFSKGYLQCRMDK